MLKNLPGKIKNALNPSEKSEKADLAAAGDIRVDSFHVRTDIKSRFATTVITSRMTNVTNSAKEVSFTSRLPEAAFITDFCMQIGDKIVHGEVKEKKAAKERYDQAKSQGQSAGHVFSKTRETDVFTISTNVGAKTEAIFTLTYQEILQRVHGAYKHVISLDLDQVQTTSDVQIAVEIMERGKINKLHVPRVGPKMGEKTNAELLNWEADPNCTIKSTIDDDSVSTSNIFCRISAADLTRHQREGGQFVVLYDLDRDISGGQVQVVNGYFVHFFAPEGLEIGGKHIIFVLDKSGSMSGRKLQQTKDAMRRILGDLRKKDLFNIIWFSDRSHLWKRKSVPATTDNVMKAISDVEHAQANGSTNIHDAVFDGLKLLTKSESSPLASMIVFMTDGQANVGPVHEPKRLVEAISKHNQGSKFIIHTMAFGYDADYDMLQKISAANNGLACRIYEDLDADVQLIGFYQQISSPLLADVQIQYTQDAVDLNSLIYDHTSTYYSGGEMMILGRLSNLRISDSDQEPLIEAEISGRGSNGRLLRLLSNCCFPLPRPRPCPNVDSAAVSEKRLTTRADTEAGEFVERMWAYQTIKKLLKESQLGFWSNPEKEAKRKEALRLSLKYRFVTELTSMVVVEEDLKKMNDTADTTREVERDRAIGCPYVGPSAATASCWASARLPAVTSLSRAPVPASHYHGCAPRSKRKFLASPQAACAFSGSSSFCSDNCELVMEEDLVHDASDDRPTEQSATSETRRCSRSRSRSVSPKRKPMSYLIILINRSNQSIDQPIDKSISDQINEWKNIMCAFFLNLFKSSPKQPFAIRLIAINPDSGCAHEAINLLSTSSDFDTMLKKSISDAFEKKDQHSGYGPIEDVVRRVEDVESKWQVWINVEDRSTASGALADVFYYLNKVAGYDYLSKDQLE